MAKYYVVSGEVQDILDASSPYESIKKAFLRKINDRTPGKTYTPSAMSRTSEKGFTVGDDTVFMYTQPILNDILQ